MKILPISLPFRDDSVFGLLALTSIVVPVTFVIPAYDHFETFKLALFLVLTGAAVLTWLWRRRHNGLSNTAFLTILVTFVAWTWISAFFSLDKNVSFLGFYSRYTSGVLFVSCWAIFIALCLFALNWEKWLALVKVLLLSSFFVTVVAVLQAYGIGLYLGPTSAAFLQAPSLLGNPNFVSMFLVGTLPFAVNFFYQSKNGWPKAWYGLLVLLHLATFALLTSRGALLALALVCVASLLAGFVGKLGRKHLLSWLAVSVVAVVATGVGLGINRPGSVEQTLQLAETNVVTRLYAWETARLAMQEHPFVGTGPGTFQFFYEQHLGKQMAGQLDLFDDAHNLFLQVAATTGIPAALLLAAAIAWVLWLGYRSMQKNASPATAAAMAGLLGLGLATCFNPVAIPCFLLLGVLMVGLVLPHAKEVNLSLGKAVSAFGSLPAAAFIVWGVCLFLSELIFYQGFVAFKISDYNKSARLTAQAQALNPFNQLYRVYNIGSDIQLGRDPETITREINAMAALHPNSAVSHDRTSNLYYLWFRQKRTRELWDKAQAGLSRAIDRNAFKARRYWQQAIYYFDINELEQAKVSVKASLSLYEKQTHAWILLSKIYQIQGQRSQLIFALEQAFEDDPEDSRLRDLLALAKTEHDVSKLPLNIVIDQGRLE